MEKSYASVLALLLAGAVCAASGSASALSCGGNWVTSPGDGATNVPTNTLIWGHGSASTTRLVGPDGEVALEEYPFPASGPDRMVMPQPVLRPAAELEPGVRYSLFSEYDSEDEYPPDRFDFVTGSGPATAPPPLPQLLFALHGAGRKFGGSVGSWVELEFASHGGILLGAIDGAPGNAPPADVMLDDDSSLEEDRAGTPVVVWVTHTHLFAGTGDCMVWPGSSIRQSARFGVMDVAGNFSGWTSDTLLELPDQREAEQIVAEADAAERARQDALVELQQSKPRMGLFEGHNTGCALGAANPRAFGGSILATLMGLAALRRCSRRRVSAQPTRSIAH